MGASLTESLQHLRERAESTNLQSFVRAVVQGERLGVSPGQVMRDLAQDMRKRRSQMAEESAQKDAGQAADTDRVPDSAHDLHRRAGPAGARDDPRLLTADAANGPSRRRGT